MRNLTDEQVEFSAKTEDITKNLKEGVVIKGPFWPEEVKVHISKIIGNRIQIIGGGLKTEKSYQTIHNIDEFQKKVKIISGLKGPKFSANPSKFRLALEAKRIRMSYEFDPLFAVGVSKIDPLPHQIEAVYDYLLKRPRIRFLLADDPGAGKTIMAGLLLKELKYRRVIERILIVVPPALVGNWKEELFEKFGEVLIEVNREAITSSYGVNVWGQGNQFIVSMDFAKQNDILDALKETHWDLVIVDEAHKLSAYRFGQKTEKSQRYKLGEVLSETTEHLLFLTATPHKGDPENFLLLLSLLDKNLFSNTQLIYEARLKNELSQVMLRRLKEDMIDEDGKPIFPPRKVYTKGYELTAQEKNLYDAVTEYVTKHFERALGDKRKNAIGFALIVLQRRLASSLRAIRKSLERRRDKLREHLINWDSYVKQIQEEKDLTVEEVEELEDMPEKERWEREDKLMSLTTAQTKEELEAEIREIERLCDLSVQVERSGTERKLNEVKKVLFDVEEIRERNEKLIIFTEYKDTADYLLEKVQQWGFTTTSIDGAMNTEQRKKAMDEFNFGDKQIMIATEAAGEGINLQQKCSLMINYDIPWNPTRLEQRMGRIHRYGQRNKVHVYNLIATNTREGRVLQVVLDKLEQMKQHLGSDRVYDVIDKLLEEENVRLDQLIKESIRNRITFEEFCKKWQRPVTEEDLEKLKRATEEALATKHVDLSRYHEKKQEAEEQRLIPEYIEQFFVEAFKDCGGNITKLDKNLWRIDHVPAEVRKALARNQVIRRYYGKVSFNKKIVKKYEDEGIECEYIAPGSLLFESVCELILEKYSHLLQEGAIFLDPEGNEEALLWFILGRITDGKGRKIGERLFAILQNKSGDFIKKGPFVLWDLSPAKNKIEFNAFDNVQIEREKVTTFVLDSLIDPYFEEIKEQRMRELSIRKKYVERSLNYLISQSIKTVGKYREKQKKGKDMQIAITREVQKQEELQHRRKKALEEIEQEKNLSPSMPEVIAVVGVVPLKTDDEELQDVMKRDEEIERIAMEIAMDFEKKEGRRPEDVSSENLGYDIKSKGDKELRYIEVKGRARIAKIVLTPNEWIKANRFKENYWLYVVANCSTKPQLYLIQDPASKLKPNEVVEITRYIVDADQWKKIGEKVS